MAASVSAKVTLCAIAVLFATGAVAPAGAYKVWVEYQGVTTVEGPLSVGAKLMLLIEPGDSPTPVVDFRVDYDCTEGVCVPPCPAYAVGSHCVFYGHTPREWVLTSFASVIASPLVFSECAGETCWCLAGADVMTHILVPLSPGVYPLAEAFVTREWMETDCQSTQHSVAEVRVTCSDYWGANMACTGGGVFRLLESTVPLESGTWGRIKALYREPGS